MTTETFVRHSHTLGLPQLGMRAKGLRAYFVAGAVLGAVLAGLVDSGGKVRAARSALNVAVGFACVPIGVAGLAGLWWGVLCAAPLFVLYDHLLGD